MFLLVVHFADVDDEQARAALDLLARQPTCRRLRFGQSTEDGTARVLIAEFDSAADYRRALSPFDVRTVVIPWLSTGTAQTSAVYEALVTAEDGQVQRHQPTVTEPGR